LVENTLREVQGIIGTILLLASTVLALYVAYEYFFVLEK
jgi:uncharacterized membrane protein required for colicin V production